MHFSFHIEDEQLCAISYSSYRSRKAYYVIYSACTSYFEEFFATNDLDVENLNDHDGGARQILVTTNIQLNPSSLQNSNRNIKVIKIVQRYKHFAILCPHVYHGDFHVRYYIEKAANIADFTRPDVARKHYRKNGTSATAYAV